MLRARILGEAVAGIQAAWVTWTIPPAAGQPGSWQSLDLARDPDDLTLWTGVLSLPSGTDPGLVNFVVQAVNGVGVTIDDNVGAFYRPGSIPGPLEPGAPPPAATSMTFITPAPAAVAFGESFPVMVELRAGGSPLSGKLVRIGLGTTEISAVTNGSGRATVTLRAALTPATYAVTGSFAGDSTHAASDVSDTVDVTARPTSLALTGTLGTRTLGGSLSITATLQALSPTTPLHQRSVFVIVKGTGPANTGVMRVFPGKTDPLGRVDLPAASLASLPVGTYSVDAYFNGVNVPGLVLAPDDLDYAHAEAHDTLALRWPFEGFLFPVVNPPVLNVMKAGFFVPLRFSLGGDRTLNIFASGYPKVTKFTCPPSPTDPIEETVPGTKSRLFYFPLTKRYWYVWKTEKSYAKTCQRITLRFLDGTEREALFKFF